MSMITTEIRGHKVGFDNDEEGDVCSFIVDNEGNDVFKITKADTLQNCIEATEEVLRKIT